MLPVWVKGVNGSHCLRPPDAIGLITYWSLSGILPRGGGEVLCPVVKAQIDWNYILYWPHHEYNAPTCAWEWVNYFISSGGQWIRPPSYYCRQWSGRKSIGLEFNERHGHHPDYGPGKKSRVLCDVTDPQRRQSVIDGRRQFLMDSRRQSMIHSRRQSLIHSRRQSLFHSRRQSVIRSRCQIITLSPSQLLITRRLS